MRIISLVPSITETVMVMFPHVNLVGCTNFCIRPTKSKLKQIPHVGGTKNPDHDHIKFLKPDLILLNKEENNKEDADLFQGYSKIWVCSPAQISEVPAMIRDLSEHIQQPISKEWESKLKFLEGYSSTKLPHKTIFEKSAYAIWKDPWMFAGGDTYIHSCMELLGIENLFSAKTRYPSCELGALHEMGIQNLFLSSEPYPFKKRHVADWYKLLEQQKSNSQEINFYKIDGRLMSWYGVSSLELMENILKPSNFKNPLFIKIS